MRNKLLNVECPSNRRLPIFVLGMLLTGLLALQPATGKVCAASSGYAVDGDTVNENSIFESPSLTSLNKKTDETDDWDEDELNSLLIGETIFPPFEFNRAQSLSNWIGLAPEEYDYAGDLSGNVVFANWNSRGNVDPILNKKYPVASQSFAWRDTVRRRTVPARIFHPNSPHDGPFPVIVFSHGLGGSYNRCAYLGQAWASRGFVAVLLQHPGSDEQVWKGKIRILNELREAYKTNWNGRTRANDIRFALDCLERMSQQGNWLAERMDLDRIGVGGYDLGALAALLVAGQTPPDRGPSLHDHRVKAVLAMSPPINRPVGGYQNVYRAVDVPTFFVTGTEDDGIVGSTKAHQRRIPFDTMSDNCRYLVVLQGADHQVYGGHMLSLRARNDKPFQAAIVRSSSCFWQGHLGEQERSLVVLRGSALNSMLGTLARVERRVNVPSTLLENPTEAPSDLQPEESPTESPESRQETETLVAVEQRPAPTKVAWDESSILSLETSRESITEDKDQTPEFTMKEDRSSDISALPLIADPREQHSSSTLATQQDVRFRTEFPLTRYYRSIVSKYASDNDDSLAPTP